MASRAMPSRATTSRLARERRYLRAREKAEGRRDLDGRRRFNRVRRALHGGAADPLRHINMVLIDQARLSFEVVVNDEIQYLIRQRVVLADRIFEADAVMADGSKRRMIVKRIEDMGEIEAQRSAHVALAVHGCKRCAQFAPIVAIASHLSAAGTVVATYALMPYERECANPSTDLAAMEMPCQLTLAQLLRGGIEVSEGAYLAILLLVVRALKVLNTGRDVFVHGDLHPNNILVRLSEIDVDDYDMRTQVAKEHVDEVLLIDTGMAYVDTEDVEVKTTAWAKKCGGDEVPHASRDLMTLFLGLAHLTPMEFDKVHDGLIKPLVEHMAANFESFQKLNQCGELLKYLGKPGDTARAGQTTLRTPDGLRRQFYWTEGDFQYEYDVTGDYARIADKNGRTMTELHHALYADTVPAPKDGPFASLAAMERALAQME